MRDGLHRVRDGGCPNNATTRRRDGATTPRALKRASRPRRARLCTAARSQREAAAARMAGVCEHKPVHLGTVAADVVPQPARQPRAVAPPAARPPAARPPAAAALAAELASSEVLPDRSNRDWLRNVGNAPAYLYAVHVGLLALSAPTFAAGLYLLLLRLAWPAVSSARSRVCACSCTRGCSSVMCVWTHFALKRADSGRRCPDRARDWSSLIALGGKNNPSRVARRARDRAHPSRTRLVVFRGGKNGPKVLSPLNYTGAARVRRVLNASFLTLQHNAHTRLACLMK